MAELDGVAVLVTRPAHQAEGLCRLLQAHGAVPVRLPLLAIGVPRAPQRARRTLADVAAARWLIVTSPNAARRLPRFLPPETALPPIACLGDGTRRALEEAGFAVALQPRSGSSSEALLDEPALGQVRGCPIIVARGEGGRRRLERVLAERGARVAAAALYRRRPTYPHPARLAQALGRCDVAIVTSSDALGRLVAITPPPLLPLLLRLQLVAPSARVVQKALSLGFARAPLVPARASDRDWVDAIRRWRCAGNSSRKNVDE